MTEIAASTSRVHPANNTETSMTKQYVYLFHEGDKDQKGLLGGKGANLAEMTKLGLPVPPGFTITTEACREYLAQGSEPGALRVQRTRAMPPPEDDMGRRPGDRPDPTTASVGPRTRLWAHGGEGGGGGQRRETEEARQDRADGGDRGREPRWLRQTRGRERWPRRPPHPGAPPGAQSMLPVHTRRPTPGDPRVRRPVPRTAPLKARNTDP